jgi:hypothetical protein
MPSNAWRSANLALPEKEGRRALGWEFLRRNEEFIADVKRANAPGTLAEDGLPTKWGLRFRSRP